MPPTFLRRLLLLFLPAALLVCAAAWLLHWSELQHQRDEFAAGERAAMRAGMPMIALTLQNLGRELLYVARQGVLQEALDAGDEAHLAGIAGQWIEFSRAHQIYEQIRWIDESGMERLRVDYAQGKPAAARAELQNKSERYYFSETMKLNAGEIYFSPLDLNIENGRVEVPYKPMIRAATPVFDSSGAKRGIIVLNYAAADMLERFKQASGERAWLVNDDGYWLKGPQPADEWGFMLQREDLSLARRYPDAWRRIVSADADQFPAPEGLWTFATIYPLREANKTSAAAVGKNAFAASRGEAQSGRYIWKKVLLLPADKLLASIHDFDAKLGAATALLLALLFAGCWLLARARTAEEALRRNLQNLVAERTRDLERMTSLYKALSEINQGIVRLHEESELFPLVCKTAVDYGGMKMAWIGQINEADGIIEPVESYGGDLDYLNGIVISSRADTPQGHGPTGTAWRENRPVIVDDYATNAITSPWRECAARHGFRSAAAFPIQRANRVAAVFNVYSDKTAAFDAEAVALLEEMAKDIGFALDNFDRDRQRRAALEALSRSEARFRVIFEQAAIGIAYIDSHTGVFLGINQKYCDIVGYSREEMTKLSFQQITHPDDLQADLDNMQMLLRGNISQFTMEKRYCRKDGGIVWVNLAVSPLWPTGEEPSSHVAIVEDITYRKRVERRERTHGSIMERLSQGAALQEILEIIARGVEAENPASLCSILLLDEARKHMRVAAAPSLPAYYNAAVDGMEIDSGQTFCAAAHTGKRIIAEDIHNHPSWTSYRGLAVMAGLGSCCSEPVRDAYGKMLGVLAIYRRGAHRPDTDDIAMLEHAAKLASFAIERKRLQEELQLALSIYRNSSEAMMVTDSENRIVAVNPAFTQITGYPPHEVIGKNPRLLKSDRQDDNFYCGMWQAVNATGRWQGEIWNRRKDGEAYLEWMTINTMFDESGAVLRRVALFSDITERKKSEELIWRQANFDPLTQLPNRSMFRDRLNQDIKKAQRAGLAVGLLFIDLDHFKEINDTLGHGMGDRLLVKAAQRISSCVREEDTVARLGGDEFTITLMGLADETHVEKIAQNIISRLAEPFELGPNVAHVSASIGISLYPADGDDADTLLKDADQAMYAAKKAGRNRFSYFTPSLQEAAQKRLQLINDLHDALAAGQFIVYFQPIVELSTDRIHKAEALLRWRHPARGMISPAEFIPVAEETGLIVEIGDWVFKESMRWAKRWNDIDPQGFQVSVNKSPVQFRAHGSNHADWLVHLQELGLPGRSLSIEITEGLLLDAQAGIVDRLLVFRDAGIQVSIDDFGTGYSALSYLKKFDIDYLKIDQSFVRNLVDDPNDQALAEAIIVMAHKLGLQVIAEGVETEAHRDFLVANGCDFAQGYLFSRPVPAEEFETLLKNNIAGRTK